MKLVTKAELDFYRGFQSVYGYPTETANIIKKQQGTYDLDGNPLFSEVLFLDFDDKPDEAEASKNKLLQWGISFKLYDTGGRGQHFHIDTHPVCGPRLPQLHRDFVRHNFPGADRSLYKTSGVIRLPNTFHSQHPGRWKQLELDSPGKLLEITEVPKEEAPVTAGVFSSGEAEDILSSLLFQSVHKSTVGRNTTAFKIACACRDTGRLSTEALDILVTWNKTNSIPPLKYWELQHVVDSAYRKLRDGKHKVAKG